MILCLHTVWAIETASDAASICRFAMLEMCLDFNSETRRRPGAKGDLSAMMIPILENTYEYPGCPIPWVSESYVV